ncbi:hypothetical protein F4821DRAFT_259658 [Hypoxylon rubiginosum]|uniref:Uncharacterized protein n=1 Tax=Hypoxylon rubiginosum TaxID=110542 RepID=A0ACC0D1U4_9PEZI|nr:hypothetical protein F4821DRAFT_259658 [Hypoxylon rubiginosum]
MVSELPTGPPNSPVRARSLDRKSATTSSSTPLIASTTSEPVPGLDKGQGGGPTFQTFRGPPLPSSPGGRTLTTPHSLLALQPEPQARPEPTVCASAQHPRPAGFTAVRCVWPTNLGRPWTDPLAATGSTPPDVPPMLGSARLTPVPYTADGSIWTQPRAVVLPPDVPTTSLTRIRWVFASSPTVNRRMGANLSTDFSYQSWTNLQDALQDTSSPISATQQTPQSSAPDRWLANDALCNADEKVLWSISTSIVLLSSQGAGTKSC